MCHGKLNDVKAVEFESILTQNGQIALPPEIVGEIPPGEHLRVVLMWEPSDMDSAWRSAARQKFEAAYYPEDDVYEQLIDHNPAR